MSRTDQVMARFVIPVAIIIAVFAVAATGAAYWS